MVDDSSPRWVRITRPIPTEPALHAEAARNPGGRVAEIDGDLVGGDPDGYVPAEAVHGAWVVDDEGRLTGEYEQNPHHGIPQDDFTKLTEPDHYLAWLPAEPATAVRTSIADLLDGQVPGATLEWLKVTETPAFLTGGRRTPDDENTITLVRAALAVPFALSVRSPDETREILWGVFTWAASGLDTADERRDRVWFDLGVGREWAEERLEERVYEVDGD